MVINRYPKISVVTPSFNQGQFLRETIESVLSQGYPNLEYIIIDGGSTDGSREIIVQYESKLAYWCSEPDSGQSAAIAKGFARAKGDLLCWLNSDDVMLPGTLFSVAHAYLRRPSAGFLAGNYILIDRDGKIIRCKRHSAQAGWFERRGLSVISPGCFWGRRDYESVGGINLDLDYVMDTDLFIRMLNNGTEYCHINDYLVAFRIHSEAKTVAHHERLSAEREEMFSNFSNVGMRLSKLKQLTLLYRIWQAINGNYLRAQWETLRYRGVDWHALSKSWDRND